MTKKMNASWNLKALMDNHCLHSTTDLLPLLAQRGVHLSRIQVYRLVTQPPIRVSMDLLAALCDILECTPNDLITVRKVNEQIHKKAVGEKENAASGKVALLKTRIHRPGKV